MMRPAAEVRDIANGLVSKIVADMIFEFPKLRAAIDRLPKTEWADLLTELGNSAEQTLLTKFGATDR